jgi:hypothetical protein
MKLRHAGGHGFEPRRGRFPAKWPGYLSEKTDEKISVNTDLALKLPPAGSSVHP